MKRAKLIGALFAVSLPGLFGVPALAHEMRPALVDIRETEHSPQKSTYVAEVRFRSPESGASGPTIAWPNECTNLSEPTRTTTGRLTVESGKVSCRTSSKDVSISVENLSVEVPEAIFRFQSHRGEAREEPITRAAPFATLRHGASRLAPWAMVRLGVVHILLGLDHLLFVLALVLLACRNGGIPRARRIREIGLTITAFTISHSITLALSYVGLLTLPVRGAEAAIALSILILALELTKRDEVRKSTIGPVWFAFGFGLIHGFGFAGALRELSLEHDSLIASLALFNIGVELGQLAFVLAVGLVIWMLSRIRMQIAHHARRLAIHGIGAVSAYYFMDRTFQIVRQLHHASPN